MSFSQVNFEIVRHNDRDLVKAIVKIAQDCGRNPGSLGISFLGGLPQHNVPFSDIETDTLLSTLLAEESYVIQSLRVEFPSNVQLSVSRSNQVFDQVSIYPGGENNRDAFLIFIAKVRKHLTAFESGATMSALLGEQGKTFQAAREASLVKLESIATSLFDDTRKYRQTLDGEFSAKVRTKEEEVQAKIQELELEHKNRFEKLQTQEKELLERAKSLDDRESRHVRRELYKSQKKKFEEISTKFALTKGTGLLRLPVHIFAILLLITLATIEGVLIYTMTTHPPSANIEWAFVMARQLFVAAGFCATAVFYLRWANRWFEQHAQEEFRLKRLDIDVDRASWLVETAMEWKDLKGSEIPDALLDRLSRNLFESPVVDDRPLHPVDQLASQLLGASAEVEVPFGKGRINIDRKGMKELKKAGND